FGLAKFVASGRVAAPTAVNPPLTVPGAILGTFAYMSPEQAMGDEIAHRTDVFSLGVVFYEMLSGVRPFRGDTPMRVIDQIVHQPPPPLGGRAAHAPEAVVRIVHRALTKDIVQRYKSAREMAADLAAWNAPSLAPAAPPEPVTPPSTPRPVVRNAVAVTTFVNV